MAGNLADVITCAKFQDEIFRGYDFTGSRISHFPIDFRMDLTTVQRDCAACDNDNIANNRVIIIQHQSHEVRTSRHYVPYMVPKVCMR